MKTEMQNQKAKRGVNRKLLYFLFILIIALISAVGTYIASDEQEGETSGGQTVAKSAESFSVHYIDVGQGDCILTVCNGKTLLIDAGENGNEATVINYLRAHGVKSLDYVIATHPHSDHIGSLAEVIEEFGVSNVIMPRLPESLTPTTKTYTDFLNAVKASGAKVIAAKPGSSYTLGSAEFEILAPIDYNTESLNNVSVVTRLVYGGKSFLFTGDAEKEVELDLIDSGAIIDSDVLKVGHHGSKTSSSKDFLNAVSPEICVIMCGENNDYGHPHKEVLNRLKKYTDRIYRTDICGSIVLTCSDGEIEVRYENE
ncbi:MAG: ComEC/Rec2 family competence protein [Acutalibacteraceae bacterium]